MKAVMTLQDIRRWKQTVIAKIDGLVGNRSYNEIPEAELVALEPLLAEFDQADEAEAVRTNQLDEREAVAVTGDTGARYAAYETYVNTPGVSKTMVGSKSWSYDSGGHLVEGGGGMGHVKPGTISYPTGRPRKYEDVWRVSNTVNMDP